MTTRQMPILFVGHGNPMNAIEKNPFHRGWQDLGHRLPKPRAILCISAHWQTTGTNVSSGTQPATIHDFYGFPRPLYEVRYPAPGAPELARDLIERTGPHYSIKLDPDRGFDHGTWSVLVAMYPAADIPVIQLSLDMHQPGRFHYDLGRTLAPLREDGILVIGSGNMVHHLGLFNFQNQTPYAWAEAFNSQLKNLIQDRNHDALTDYPNLGQDARLAIPTAEHYLPLLYVLGMSNDRDPVQFFNDRIVSSVSMTSVVFGG